MNEISSMKKIFWTIISIAVLTFSSCSNKVDLYSNDADNTIIYAMLDAYSDTNYVKVTKSFAGNIDEIAPIYDSTNYQYGEIEVTISGIFEGSSSTQTIHLDTISKFVAQDDNTPFYSNCWQTYYYTTAKLKEGNEYTINVHRVADSVDISATTNTINNFRIIEPVIVNTGLKFKDAKRGKVKWKVEEFPCLSTAAYFSVTGYFHYSELMPGATDTVKRSIAWGFGSGEADKLFNTTDLYYMVNYTPEALFDVIGNDQYLKNNSPYAVKRWFEKFEIRVSAIGDELYKYNLVNNSSSAIQDVPNYSNVENGQGLVSSRVSKSNFYKINILSRNYIKELYPTYGFIVDPNR